MNILLFGDSITWGSWDDQGGWAQRVKNFADTQAKIKNYDSYTAVYCLGVSGDTTNDLLQRFSTELEARMDYEEPITVFVAIGINDSIFDNETKKHLVNLEDFLRNLEKIEKISSEDKVKICFIGLTPVNDDQVDPIPWLKGSSYKQEFVQEYEKVLKKFCEENNLPFIEVMSSFLKNDYKSLLSDGVHPNTQGHNLIFQQVKTYLKKNKLI